MCLKAVSLRDSIVSGAVSIAQASVSVAVVETGGVAGVAGIATEVWGRVEGGVLWGGFGGGQGYSQKSEQYQLERKQLNS